MPVVIELVHAEPGRRVVLARQLDAGTTLASALGEAASAEEAEDRARARLQIQPPPQPQRPAPVPTAVRPAVASTAAASTAPTKPPLAVSSAQAPAVDTPLLAQSEQTLEQQIEFHMDEHTDQQADQASGQMAEDPEDWSSELASLDLQLKRLGWGREQEAVYLLRAFGHSSRSRLTTYGDLMTYLRALESFAPGTDPASCLIPLKRSDLLSQSDQLLAQLGWDAARGRQLLEGHFGRNSRQQLSDAQLLEFNMLLETEAMAAT